MEESSVFHRSPFPSFPPHAIISAFPFHILFAHFPPASFSNKQACYLHGYAYSFLSAQAPMLHFSSPMPFFLSSPHLSLATHSPIPYILVERTTVLLHYTSTSAIVPRLCLLPLPIYLVSQSVSQSATLGDYIYDGLAH